MRYEALFAQQEAQFAPSSKPIKKVQDAHKQIQALHSHQRLPAGRPLLHRTSTDPPSGRFMEFIDQKLGAGARDAAGRRATQRIVFLYEPG